jgi:hypothetical protein
MWPARVASNVRLMFLLASVIPDSTTSCRRNTHDRDPDLRTESGEIHLILLADGDGRRVERDARIMPMTTLASSGDRGGDEREDERC